MKQGGFEIDGTTIQDPSCKVDLSQTAEYRVRVGKKKFFRIIVEF
jgi:tyrosyl-tRNA synthetase